MWGVNRKNKIFYREGTFGDTGDKGSDWIEVTYSGSLTDQLSV